MTTSLTITPSEAATPSTADNQSLCIHCDLPVPLARRGGDDQSARFCCFGCRFAYQLARPVADGEASADGRANTLTIRLGLGIFLAMNVMVFSWLFYSPQVYGDHMTDALAHRPLQSLFAYLLMFLTGLVLAALGSPIAEDALNRLLSPVPQQDNRTISAWISVLAARIDTNLLICMGVCGAYVFSVIHTLQGAGHVYYDTAVLILVLVTLGNYVDSAAKRRAAGSMDDLLARVPNSALVQRNGEWIEIDADDVRIDEIVNVRSGDAAATDGVVTEGSCFVDESSLTGESKPRSVEPGDAVLAGAIVLDGRLQLRATRVGRDRTISKMRDLLDQARRKQLPLQRIADRIAAAFVPFVIALALGVLMINVIQHEPMAGLLSALSILLISCPCALGLAAPLATWSALRRAAQRGILIDSAVTLEKLAGANVVAFDKTGTLTESNLAVAGIETFTPMDERRSLQIAAAIEHASNHPIARAITERAGVATDASLPATDVKVTPGLGVSATVKNERFHLGSTKFAATRGHEVKNDSPSPCVFLFTKSELLARFDLQEKLRDDAAQTIRSLQALHIDSHMLTGDAAPAADLIAEQLEIKAQSSLLPEDKIAALREMQGVVLSEREASAPRHSSNMVTPNERTFGNRGAHASRSDNLQSARRGRRIVVMVGDGINDAPVLAAADVGIAMGGATDLAAQAGHVRLIGDQLDRVPLAIRIAKHGMRRVKLNLLWTFGYNTIGLSLAAAGLLSPIFAASAMFASSLLIIATSRKAGEVAHG